MRIEPPPSLPSASGTRPAATAAADPALDPPVVRSGFHGLRVVENSGLWPTRAISELGGIGLADNDRAGPAQPFYDDVVLARHVVLVER